MSGVPDDWARHHHLTPRLNFSHNLSGVFPPELYDEHPEFFPLEGGKRLRPPKGSGFWNPDIAREDAARYAAEAARKYFDANPGEVSFALGVNDALIWGESPELRALTRARSAERTEGRGQTAEKNETTSGASPSSAVRPPSSGAQEQETGSDEPGWFRERPNYSNLVFTFMNRVAVELAKTHPAKYVGALAYYWAESAPDFPLHPQVIPFLTADRAQGYDATARREELELQEQWGRIGGRQTTDDGGRRTDGGGRRTDGGGRRTDGGGRRTDGGRQMGDKGEIPDVISQGPPSAVRPLPSEERRLGIYDYLYGSGYRIPRIWTKLLAEHLRHARRAGFTDYYAEVSPNWGLDGPMPWLTAQLLQDPEQSEAVLLDEYYRRYFREAAEPMRRFFERCEELWMAQPGPPYWLKHFRNESQAVIFSPAACRELRALLDEAEVLVNGWAVRSARGRMNRENDPAEAAPGTARPTFRIGTDPTSVGRALRARHDVATALRYHAAPGTARPTDEARHAAMMPFERAGLSKVRARVQFVSDAFGVTERFVAFQEARVRLTRLALRAKTAGQTADGSRQRAEGSVSPEASAKEDGRRAEAGGQMAEDRGQTADGREQRVLRSLGEGGRPEGSVSSVALAKEEGQRADDGGSRAAGAVVGRPPSVFNPRSAWVDPGPSHFAHDLATALRVYLDARREYIHYTLNLARAEPLAVRAYGWDDYLRNDPGPLALLTLRRLGWVDGSPEVQEDGGQRAGSSEAQGAGGAEDRKDRSPEAQTVGGQGRVGTGPLEFRNSGIPIALAGHPSAGALWKALFESGPLEVRNSGIPNGRELLRNPAMTGILLPGRSIAGLPYGIALPAGWFSRVEPAEFHRAALTGPDEARVLKISGSKDSVVSQWTRVGGTGLHRARVSVRGHVSPGTAVALVFSWLNSGERHVGSTTVRLPDGAWPEWVTLEQAGLPPPGAVWVGLGLRVQHQVAEDWVEAKGFSLTAP